MREKRIKVGVLGVAALVIVAALQSGSAQPARSQSEAESDDATTRSADANAIRASAKAFVQAFNAGNAKAAAEQFLPQAEYLNSDGETFAGREEIEKDLSQFFKEFPKAKIELEIDSIRFVGPRIAIEEGRTAVTREPGMSTVRQSYVAVDLLVGDQWQLVSVREMPLEEEATPHDHLESLAWLVGEWIDESDSGVVKTTCRWSEDGNYLLQDFQLLVSGRKAVSGQQRIGWDPLTQHIKSWVFDSQGGYGEGLWTWNGERWIVKAQGVRPDGVVASATNSYAPQGSDAYVFESTNRLAGDNVQPDTHVIVVRRPPAPGGKGSDSVDESKPK